MKTKQLNILFMCLMSTVGILPAIADDNIDYPTAEYFISTGDDEGMFVYEFIPAGNGDIRCVVSRYGMDCYPITVTTKEK